MTGKPSSHGGIILRSASITLAGLIYQMAISFASGVIVARVLGPSLYGIFSVARTLCESAAAFTKLGLDIGFVRYFGEHSRKEYANSNAHLLSFALKAVLLIASIPVLALLLGGGRLIEQHIYKYEDFSIILLAMSLSIPLMSILQVLGGAFRGYLQITPRVIAEYFLQPSSRLAIAVALFAIGWRIWGVIVGTVLSLGIASVYLIIRKRHIFMHNSPANMQSGDEAPFKRLTEICGYSIVVSLTVAASGILLRSDVIVLGYFSSAKEIGNYVVIQMLVGLIGIFNAALNQAVAPLLAKLNKDGDSEEMFRIVRQHTRWVMAASLPIFLLMSFYGSQLAGIFGKEYDTSPTIFMLLGLGQLVVAVFASSGFLLSMTGRHTVELYVMTGALLAAFVLNLVFIPTFGLPGAALAILTSVIVANGARMLVIYKAFGKSPVDRRIMRTVLIGGVCFMAASALMHLVGIENKTLGAIVTASLFLVLYFSVLTRWGFEKNDQQVLKSILRRILTVPKSGRNL